MVSRNTYKFFFFLSLLFFFSFTADDNLKTIYTIRSKADFFTTDNFGNTYLIKAEEIRKYTATGDLLKIYSNKNLGKITSVDASNSLRLLVFYKDFASIAILDDQLSQNSDII